MLAQGLTDAWRSCWIPPCGLPGHGSRRGRRPRQPAGRPPSSRRPGRRPRLGRRPGRSGQRSGTWWPAPARLRLQTRRPRILREEGHRGKEGLCGTATTAKKGPHGEEDRDQEDGGDHEGSGQAGDRGRMTALVFVPLDRTEASPARRHRPRTAARLCAHGRSGRRRRPGRVRGGRVRGPHSCRRPGSRCRNDQRRPGAGRGRRSRPGRRVRRRAGQVTVTGLGWRQVQSLFADELAAAAVAGARRPPRDCRWP